MPVPPEARGGSGEGPLGGRGKEWNRSPLERAGGNPPGAKLDRETPKDTRPWPLAVGKISDDNFIPQPPLSVTHQFLHPESRPRTPSEFTVVVNAADKTITEIPKQPSYLTPANGMALSPEQLAAGEYYKAPKASDILNWAAGLPTSVWDKIQVRARTSNIPTPFKSLKEAVTQKGPELEKLRQAIVRIIGNENGGEFSPAEVLHNAGSVLEGARNITNQATEAVAWGLTSTYVRYRNDPRRLARDAVTAVILEETARYAVACNRSPIPFPSTPPPAATEQAKTPTTVLPEKTPTAVIIGELTPVAKAHQDVYKPELNSYLSSNLPFKDEYSNLAVIHFVVNRGDLDNPEFVPIISDGGLTKFPTDNDASFNVAGGNLYAAIIDQQTYNLQKIVQLATPKGQSLIRYNPDLDRLEYLDSQGKVINTAPVNPDKPARPSATPTEAPTVTSTPTPSPIATEAPTAAPTLTRPEMLQQVVDNFAPSIKMGSDAKNAEMIGNLTVLAPFVDEYGRLLAVNGRLPADVPGAAEINAALDRIYKAHSDAIPVKDLFSQSAIATSPMNIYSMNIIEIDPVTEADRQELHARNLWGISRYLGGSGTTCSIGIDMDHFASLSDLSPSFRLELERAMLAKETATSIMFFMEGVNLVQTDHMGEIFEIAYLFHIKDTMGGKLTPNDKNFLDNTIQNKMNFFEDWSLKISMLEEKLMSGETTNMPRDPRVVTEAVRTYKDIFGTTKDTRRLKL